MDGWIKTIVDSLIRYVGQTVTIFTASGGKTGCGFTGVLLFADCNTVKLLADIGAAPACPIGSSCKGCCDLECCGNNYGGYGYGYGYGGGYGCGGGCGCGGGYGYGGGNNYGNPFYSGNALGAVCVIPTSAIVCFTHNAI